MSTFFTRDRVLNRNTIRIGLVPTGHQRQQYNRNVKTINKLKNNMSKCHARYCMVIYDICYKMDHKPIHSARSLLNSISRLKSHGGHI